MSLPKQFVILSIVLAVIGGLAIIATIVLGILYGVERNKTVNNQTTADTDGLCLTPYCIYAANYLLDSIDETVDPCENFFDFGCGTWIKNARIPDDNNFQSSFNKIKADLNSIIRDLLSSLTSNDTLGSKALSNARRLYASCVDEDAIETQGADTILSFVNIELGGWPILQGSTWNNATFNYSRVLLKLSEYMNSVFYKVVTQVDATNSSLLGIAISQNSLALVDRNFYVTENDITKVYRQLIRDIAMELTNDTSMIENDINDIFAFEQLISKYVWTLSEQSAREKETVRTTIANLSTAMNASFDFVDYLRRLYGLVNITLVDTDIVIVNQLEYMRSVSSIINQQSPRTLQNYMVWRFIMNQASIMPKKFRNIKQQFDKIFQGVGAETPRDISCGELVNAAMGFAVAKLYIKGNFDKTARNQSLEIINNIRNVFIDIVNQSTWMDSVSKARAIDKARAIKEKIAYPDYLDDDNMTELEEIYADYNFNSSFVLNYLYMLKINMNQILQLLRETFDRTKWSTTPIVVDAFYRPSVNDITFPAGILRPSYFHKDAPKYLNYAGIGTVMGHEITHGFDDTGRQYDKYGNKISWWTNDTIDAFNKRKECIIKQYSNYTLTQINLQVNGEQTQSENIADNGGLKEAFFAYQKWAQTHPYVDKKLPGLGKYSIEQLFFMNYAQQWCTKGTDQFYKNQIIGDPHSPARFRVIGTTSNFEEFDRAFACKPGQGNSRVNKCSVW